ATLDSTILTLTALAVLLSGVIIKLYGFNTLFICAFILNSLSVIPYFVFLMYYSDLKTKRK
ncbi:MAG TPA: hypothetical protein VK338_04295, partial [Candidatus Nitrosocosmicus sp.]|nr:hypothetical protein [Candidatus Nitrosocosmicus sp.]